jgi:hypothetical protein
MAEGVIGAERSSQARIIPEPDVSPPSVGTKPRAANPTDPWPLISTLPRGWRGIGLLMLVALAAESIATLASNAAWPASAFGLSAVSMERTIYALVAALVVYIALRVWSGRPSVSDAMLLFFASTFAISLFTPVLSVARALIEPASPSLWTRLYDVMPDVLPYALFDGIALAIVLVALSLGLRATRSIVARRLGSPAAPRATEQ